MYNKEEKLSLLSDLIDLVRADHPVNEQEYHFIRAIALNMQVGEEELNKLFCQRRPRYIIPVTEPERILHFQRLLLMMNLQPERNRNEIQFLKDASLRMGLNPVAVDEILRIMEDYPDRIVPPKVMIDIFRIHYN